MHRTISHIYNWHDVSCRTEIVYKESMSESGLKNIDRMRKYMNVGKIVGPLFILVFTLGHIIVLICEYFRPDKVTAKTL